MVPGSLRLRAQNRLSRPSEFQSLFAAGKRYGDKHFLIIAGSNNCPEARLGLAIPKKHLPLSVSRNTLKRIIRESFRKHKAKLKGLDIIVVCKRPVSLDNRQRIFEALEKHWKKVEK